MNTKGLDIEHCLIPVCSETEGDGEEGEGSRKEQNIAWLLHTLHRKMALRLPTREILKEPHGPSVLRILLKKRHLGQITLQNIQTDPF